MTRIPPAQKLALCGLCTLFFIGAVGCAEGPLWRTGYVSPWARKKWAEEERLVTTLRERRAEIKQWGIAARSKSGEVDAATESLAKVALDDKALLVRYAAIQELGKAHSLRAVETLDKLASDPEEEIRVSACEALAQHSAPEAMKSLQRVLTSDTEPNVRLAAARGLGAFRSDEAVATLVAALDDPSPALQYRIVESLHSASGKHYGDDLDAWKAYARGEAPPEPKQSIASQIRSIF